MNYKILIVDDEPANLRMLERLFRDTYDVLTATSGTEALELLHLNDIALIISDQRMPGMTGIEFLKQAAKMRQQTVRIILTGYTDVSDLVEAINCEVIYKYITKPWVNTDLLQTVRRGIDHFEVTKGRHLVAQENQRLQGRIQATIDGFVNAFKEIISFKNSSLAEHSRRTSNYASRIGAKLGLAAKELTNLNYAALLHEVPNIRMPFEMAISKSALSAAQFQATKNNYEKGLSLISQVPDFEDVALILRYQHEHFDGSGFFDGLDGERIPLGSRILAVANVFDEINSSRNPALFCSGESSSDWLSKRAGSEFDPRVVGVCLGSEMASPIASNGVGIASVMPRTDVMVAA